jgi:hypothetical protein
VDELRLAAVPVAEGLQHGVDVPLHARAALDGEAGRLVEDEHLRILVKERGPEKAAAVGLRRGRRLRPHVARLERGHAHLLAGREPRGGLHATAVHPHLAGAQQLLQMAEAEARIVQLEPAVEPHPGLVALHLACLDAAHVRDLEIHRPSAKAAMLEATESAT